MYLKSQLMVMPLLQQLELARSATFSGLTAGASHTVVATATDGAGNSKTATISIKSDNSPPDTTITGAFDGKGIKLVNGGQTTSTGAKFYFTGTGNTGIVSSFKCQIDSAAPTSATITNSVGMCSYSNMQASIRHTFRVWSVDPAGNMDPTPVIWTWKINPPKLK